jgi:hypothetical protein
MIPELPEIISGFANCYPKFPNEMILELLDALTHFAFCFDDTVTLEYFDIRKH